MNRANQASNWLEVILIIGRNLANKLGDAGEKFSHVTGQGVDHPWPGENQYDEHDDQLGNESQRHFIYGGRCLKNTY